MKSRVALFAPCAGVAFAAVPPLDLPAPVGTSVWHAHLRFGAALAVTGGSNPLRARFVP